MSNEPVGSINWFVCSVCDGLTITINQDVGITPDTIECRANGKIADCPGWAASAHYPAIPLPDGRLYSVWAWFRPESGYLAPSQGVLNYLQAGGLVLRDVVLTDQLRDALAKERAKVGGQIRRARINELPDPRRVLRRGPIRR